MRSLVIWILFSFMAVASCYGQLNEMSVCGMERIGETESGPLNPINRKPYALLVIDIEDSKDNIVNGEQISPLTMYKVRPADAGDKLYDAYAEAFEDRRAKKMVLHHSDFKNCTVEFSEYLGNEELEGGAIYRVKVKVPSLQLMEANRCFNDMDFRNASKAYSGILRNEGSGVEDKIIATTRMEKMDSLISFLDKATAYENSAKSRSGREKDRDLYRARIYYNKILKESGLEKGALKIDELNKLLKVKSKDESVPSLNRIKVLDADVAGNDTRARGNNAVYYTDDKGKKRSCALLVIDIPLNGMEIKSERCVGEPIMEYGKYLLYVKTEGTVSKTDDPVLFSVTHPDFEPFAFHLSDLADKSLQGETAYAINLDTPSLIMRMANNSLASLNFNDALDLYRYDFQDPEEQRHADNCKSFLQSGSIIPILKNLGEDVRKCNALEKEYLLIGTGNTKFNTPDERSNELKRINQMLDEVAVKLASNYKVIYSEAARHGLDLRKAANLAEEYDGIKNGLRKLPLIIEFKEIEQLQSGVYRPESPLSLSPTVKVEFYDGSNKKVEELVKPVKDGKVSLVANTRSSYLFKEGRGKIRISTPKENNYDSKGRNYQPYDETEIDLNKFKISDFNAKKLNVTLIKKPTR